MGSSDPASKASLLFVCYSATAIKHRFTRATVNDNFDFNTVSESRARFDEMDAWTK